MAHGDSVSRDDRGVSPGLLLHPLMIDDPAAVAEPAPDPFRLYLRPLVLLFVYLLLPHSQPSPPVHFLKVTSPSSGTSDCRPRRIRHLTLSPFLVNLVDYN